MRRGAKPAKAKVEAKPPIARRARKSEGSRVRDLEKRLAEAVTREAEALKRESEALEQQTATSDILRVISRSQTDMQPVFDAIVGSAVRLLRGHTGALTRVAGDQVELSAYRSTNEVAAAALRALFPRSLQAGGPATQTVRDRAPVNIADQQTDPQVPEPVRAMARVSGHRSVVWVPLLRHNQAVGGIGITRREPGGFSDDEIALLQTFADQAVIAIENARLFGETKEALDEQTATSEILRVISGSPRDVQPVFEVVVRSAVRLLGGASGYLTQLVGDELQLAALTTTGAEGDQAARARFPLRVDEPGVNPEAVRERAPRFVADMEIDPRMSAQGRDIARARGYRSMLAVPMMRDGAPIGTISVNRPEPGPFTEKQISLLQTFADQAVIAVENVRLFRELQEKNRALTQAHAQVMEALEQQMATSEILRVISQSPTDVQPVFDTILRSAVRLCDGFYCALFLVDGGMLHFRANHNIPSQALEELNRAYPTSVRDGSTGSARAVRDRRVVHTLDMQEDPEIPEGSRQRARVIGHRSWIGVPMLREGTAIGTIAVSRAEVKPFSEGEIALLKTFADQAVIAIENVRLFKELQTRTHELTQSVEQLTALGEVGRALSSTLDLEIVLRTIVNRAVQLSAADAGTILEYDEPAEVFHPRVSTEHQEVVEALRGTGLRKGEGAVGRMAVTREPVQIPDIGVESAYESRVRDALLQAGRHAVLALPLLREEHIIGGLVISRNVAGEFPVEVIELLKTFATQSALAIQNARLFREIEDKSRQLEVASQHKSEFLANMSHELRTPLNAIVGYSELLEEEAGELGGGRLVPDLQKIASAAKHQLSLINDILDLSKVEAGRMELEVADFDLPSAIDNAVTLVRERATRRSIALGRTIGDRVGVIQGDERKVKQVLLNLLSNALKFTPEGGRIDVGATLNEGVVEVSVADTGTGIAPEDQEAVFEEFRQVGTADKKVEGTGLGLALSRKFIELHGGRIWVKSQVGQGSTFTFTLPVRHED